VTHELTEAQRASIFQKVVEVTACKFADPKMNGRDWKGISAAAKAQIIHAEDRAEFEKLVNDMLQKLGTSHIGFFHGDRPKSPGRIALAASFLQANIADGMRWMFQDVHPGGLAARAAIEPGDALLQLDGEELFPPKLPSFELASTHQLLIRKRNGDTTSLSISIPPSASKKRPLVVPDQVVTSRRVDRRIGYVKVSMFPGLLGIDVARDISRAIAELSCQSLILDLRGNTGGGIGCLRLMSILCPDKRGVGYSLGRAQIEKETQKESLPIFDKVPDSKWAAIPLIFKFGLAGRSVAISTEGFGAADHHGRVAVLVNEHSASASEMVAAFASEYGLAHLLGNKTPGKLVAASSFKMGFGYRLALPVGAYFTWLGAKLEGKGVDPSVHVATVPEDLIAGRDAPLEKAVEVLGA
jgi:carboxyl-terminal processing protease